jgi:dihydroneopterin aldolase
VSIPDGLDRIDLRGIAAHGRHGLFDFERQNGQTFVVDVSLGLDLGPAARDHDLSKSVNYNTIAERVHAAIVNEPVDLIETLALRIVDMCLAEESVRWVSVTVHKPEAPITVPFDDVTVTIERSRP